MALMAEILDYSAGRPAPAAVVAGRYAGVVRYAGTRGRGKNLTRAEAQGMLAAGVPVGLVHEAGAGWMLAGAAAGGAAARAVLADAAECGVGVRCVYFAADFDVTDAAQMAAVERCLDGAARVLGRGRVGVYGEADVIDACLGAGHATWGWQTKAWSHGRVSSRAHLLQQIGAVTVGGIECDRNTVLRPDWGQWPAPGSGGTEEGDMSDEQYAALTRKLDDIFRLLSVGDAPDSQKDASGKTLDRGGHPFNLESVRNVLASQGKQLAATNAAVGKLADLVAGKNGLSAAEVRSAVLDAVRDGVVSVDIHVADTHQTS
jgi:hypothetical protein